MSISSVNTKETQNAAEGQPVASKGAAAEKSPQSGVSFLFKELLSQMVDYVTPASSGASLEILAPKSVEPKEIEKQVMQESKKPVTTEEKPLEPKPQAASAEPKEEVKQVAGEEVPADKELKEEEETVEEEVLVLDIEESTTEAAEVVAPVETTVISQEQVPTTESVVVATQAAPVSQEQVLETTEAVVTQDTKPKGHEQLHSQGKASPVAQEVTKIAGKAEDKLPQAVAPESVPQEVSKEPGVAAAQASDVAKVVREEVIAQVQSKTPNAQANASTDVTEPSKIPAPQASEVAHAVHAEIKPSQPQGETPKASAVAQLVAAAQSAVAAGSPGSGADSGVRANIQGEAKNQIGLVNGVSVDHKEKKFGELIDKLREKLPTHVQDKIIDRIRSIMDESVSRGRFNNTVIMHLKPEDLGAITVKVTQRGDQVFARITPESQEVEAALRSRAGELTQILASNGIKVDNIQVSIGAEANEQGNLGFNQLFEKENKKDSQQSQAGNRNYGLSGKTEAANSALLGKGALNVKSQAIPGWVA